MVPPVPCPGPRTSDGKHTVAWCFGTRPHGRDAEPAIGDAAAPPGFRGARSRRSLAPVPRPLRPARRCDLSRRQFAGRHAEGDRGAAARSGRAGMGRGPGAELDPAWLDRPAGASRRQDRPADRGRAGRDAGRRFDLGQPVQAAGRRLAAAARARRDPVRDDQLPDRSLYRGRPGGAARPPSPAPGRAGRP